MRVGETPQGMQISEDEIWAKLEDAWRKQIGSGAQASPEIYQAALSDVLRSFVNTKREGATLALRQFGQAYPYENARERLAEAAAGVAVVARTLGERTLGGAEQRLVDQAKAEGQAQARLGFTVALLVALVILLVYVLDHTPARLTWQETPQSVSATVGWRTPWLDEASAASIVASPWRLEQARKHDEAFDDKQWFVAYRTQACQDALDSSVHSGAAAAATVVDAVAQQIGAVVREPVRIQTFNHGYNQYIASVFYSASQVDPLRGISAAPGDATRPASGMATESTSAVSNAVQAHAWLETAQLVVPDGLSAIRVVMARYTVAEHAPEAEVMVARATRTVAGRTLLCKAPTIWGWWFDRDRYLE